MADFLDEKLKEIDARLKELRPQVEEFKRLETARNALSGVTEDGTDSGTSRRRGPGRPRGSGSGRRGRPRGGNTRGKEALELVRSERPDVAVLDVAMPKLDGVELTRRLRSDPDTSAVRIVLLTARVQERDTDTGIAAGAHEYIRKPFSPQDLQERIAALLRQGSA